MKNEENLDQDESRTLNELRDKFPDLGMADIMKEKLRNIYALAENHADAELMFADWLDEADKSEIPELMSMAKTIREHFAGVIAYWKTGGITSGAVEGFNNKIRWLVKQAYGYRDWDYFKLKIFDLPNIKIKKEL